MTDGPSDEELGDLFRVIPVEGEPGVYKIVPVEEDVSLMGKGDKKWAEATGGLFRVTPIDDEPDPVDPV